MPISRRRRSNTLWSLQPSHGDWIQCMKIPKNLSGCSSAPKNDNFWSCKHRRMCISRRRWCPRNLGLSKLIGINIKYISIIKISIALGLSGKIMSPKDNNGSTRQCCSMSTSLTWTNTLNNWICPLPSSDLQLLLREFRWLGIALWILTLGFGLALMTYLWMIGLLHLLHVGTLLLLVLLLLFVVGWVWGLHFNLI